MIHSDAADRRIVAAGRRYRPRPIAQIERILTRVEDCCVVTQGVRAAIPVDMQALDSRGTVLKS